MTKFEQKLGGALVQAGVVSDDVLQAAIRRQIELGGRLDTNLLELGAVDQAALVKHLEEAAGLPVATLDQIEQIDTGLIRGFPSRLALRYRIIPFLKERKVLHIIVNDPLDLSLIEEIQFLLNVSLKPYVVPEVWLEYALNKYYGIETHGRFLDLHRKIWGAGPASEAPTAPSAPAAPVVPPEHPDHTEYHRTPVTAPVAAVVAVAPPSPESPRPEPPAPAAAEPSPEPARTAVPVKPYTYPKDFALADLEKDVSRDDILATALRFLWQQFDFSAVFVVAGGRVKGFRCLGGTPGAAEAVRDFSAGLDESSIFKIVADTRSQFLGPVAPSAVNDRLIGALGRPAFSSALLLPLLVKGRVVGILYTDNGVEMINGSVVPELTGFAAEVSGALENLIRKKKAGPAPAERPAAPPPVVRQTVEEPPPPPVAQVPVEEPPPPPVAQVPVEESPPPPVAQVPVEEPPPSVAQVPVEEPPPPPVVQVPVEEPPPPSIAETPAGPPVVVEVEPPAEMPPPLPWQRASHPEPTPAQVELAVPAEVGETPGAAPLPEVSAETSDGDEAAPGDLDRALGSQPEAGPPSGETPPPTPIVGEVHRPVDAPAPASPPEAAQREEEAARLAAAQHVETVSVGAGVVAPGEGPAAPSEAVEFERFKHEKEVERLYHEMEASGRGVLDDAFTKIVEHGEYAIPVLKEKFPGRLRIDPLSQTQRDVAEVEEHSDLIRLLIAIGRPSVEPLCDLTRDTDVNRRFYAVFSFSKLRYPEAIPFLLDRIFDTSPKVRLIALDVLSRFRSFPKFAMVTSRLRSEIAGNDALHQRIAAIALGQFKDAESIPQLIKLIGSKDEDIAEAALQALIDLTKQNFGDSERKWVAWWRDNKEVPRTRWLIEGLKHKDEDIRFMAIEELREVTGNFFSYYHDAPKKDRDKAVEKWEAWYRQQRPAGK